MHLEHCLIHSKHLFNISLFQGVSIALILLWRPGMTAGRGSGIRDNKGPREALDRTSLCSYRRTVMKNQAACTQPCST